MKFLLTIIVSLSILISSSAQDVVFGFKTGLNYSKINIESEKDASGNELETSDFRTGFQIGMMVSYPFTDEFGVRGELSFSQRGAKYKYEGMGTRNYTLPNGIMTTATGPMTEIYAINNGYIEVPLMAYYKIGGKVEVSGGVSLGLLVTSKAAGERTFRGDSKDGNEVFQYTRTLTYNYLSEDGGATEEGPTVEVLVDGESLIFSRDQSKDPSISGELYNRLETTGIVGLAYYFNNTFSFGVTAQYGLSDVTNNDVQKIKQIDQDQLYVDGLLKKSKDTNLNFSATISFSF